MTILILKILAIIYIYVFFRLCCEGIFLQGIKNKAKRIFFAMLWPIKLVINEEYKLITWIKRRIM